MKLTERERDVLDLVCDGATSKEIGHRLGISEQAVKAHISRLFRKYGVTNRAGLAAAATEVRVARRQAISDRYHARARALGRENVRLRGAVKKLTDAAKRRAPGGRKAG